jgi:predicted PurR-regulated permease PerM
MTTSRLVAPIQPVFAILIVTLLTGLSLWIMRPFLLALIWAAALAVATWPMLLALRRRFGGRRVPAAALMALLTVTVFVLPLMLLVGAIAEHASQISAGVASLQSFTFPTAPHWLARLPMGDRLATAWNELAGAGWSSLQPYLGRVVSWLAANMGNVGGAVVEIVLTVVLATILYFQGDVAGRGVVLFFRRLGGARGERAVLLAAQAVRGVAFGVIGTAATQSILAGVGLGLAGVPFALPLTFVAFVLSLAQVGPLLVLLPAAGWLYWSGSTGAAVALLVLSVVLAFLDNLLRPFLVRKGADLPLLLIFAGVLGGLLSMGLIGLFVGPVVLAVTYRLIEEWVLEDVPDVPAPGTGSP